MKLITWNVQWCRGLDGRVDPARIATEINGLGDFDVICLQELADNFVGPALPGSAGEDQFAALAAHLPAYTLVAGCAVDHPSATRAGAQAGRSRSHFGNAILSRHAVGQVFRHSLPFPHDPGVRWMPRIALEAVLDTDIGPLRVITTHLEYFSRRQRAAQVEALRALYAEGHGYAGSPPVGADGSPFHDYLQPAETLICGDFNMPATDPSYARMLAPFDDDTPPLLDGWRVAAGGMPQPPTFCVHEPYAPGMQPFACDFVFVNTPLRPHVQHLQVDRETRASDHQPVIITLA